MKPLPQSILLLYLLCACVQPPSSQSNDSADPMLALNPAKSYVKLPGSAEGWTASLLMDNDPVGVWRMEPLQFFPQYATPEVVGLDDQGTCWVMVSYSGKWTPHRVIHDQEWLGAIDHADVDPSAPGKEMYVGGKKGVLYQVRSYADGGLDARRIATCDGREIHTLLAGDLDPRHTGPELLVFTRPGGLYRVEQQADGTFVSKHLVDLPGRIRDARVLSDGRTIVTASRHGKVSLLQITEAGLQWREIFSQDVGFGRLAIGKVPKEDPNATVIHSGPMMPVIYSSADNGRVFRHEPKLNGGWETTTIYSGPLGPRGLVSGQFDPDPERETVAVFGYSGRLELLTRDGAQWTAKILFSDRDRGHWLSVAELDGRNSTDEILLSGYGARMVMLATNPGTGVAELSVPAADDRHAQRGMQQVTPVSASAPANNAMPSALPKVVKVAACQIEVGDDLERNLQAVQKALQEAASMGADIACFPETCLQGWVNPNAHQSADPIPGPTTERLSEMARASGLMIGIGLAERDGDRLHDSAILIDRDGTLLLKHRKVNILTELMDPPYTPGKGGANSVVDTRFGRIGLLICADTFQDDVVRQVADQKPDLVLVPYGWAAPEKDWPQHGKSLQSWVAHTSRRTQAPVVGVDCVGSIAHGPWRGFQYGGQSVASDASGKILGVLADRAQEVRIFEIRL